MPFRPVQTQDNAITNRLVDEGALPESQREIFPQKSQGGFRPVDMTPLDPAQNSLGVKSNPLLGEEPKQPKGRIGLGFEAFGESFVGGFKKFGSGLADIGGSLTGQTFIGEQDRSVPTPEGQRRGLINRAQQFGRGLTQLTGGAGAVVTSPIAAPIGAFSPEIGKAARFVSEKLPDPAKERAAQFIESIPQDVKAQFGDVIDSLGLLAIPSKAPALAAKKALATRAGKAFKESSKRTKQIRKASFIDDLIRPEVTKKVGEEQVKRAIVKGAFKKKVVPLSKGEAAIKKEVLKIKDLKPNMTKQEAFNVISKENVKKATQLESALQKNDFFFPKRELRSRLSKARQELAKSPTLVGDAQSMAQRFIDKMDDLVEQGGAKGSSLLKARKAFDKFVKAEKPKAFDPTSANAFDRSLKTIRKTVNDFLDEKATSVAVKKSLREQRTLFNALENITPKAAKEAQTVLGRAVQRATGLLGEKNKVIKEIAAASVAIPAVTLAPSFVAGAGLTFAGIKGAKAAITSPALRSSLGKLLTELGKLQVSKTGVSAGAIISLKKEIESIMQR